MTQRRGKLECCQYQNVLDTGSRFKLPMVRRLKDVLRKVPFLVSVKRRAGQVLRSGKKRDEAQDTKPAPEVPLDQKVLDLQPGEWVEVRSAEEISAMLDSKGCFERARFLQGMWKFCGRRFQVLKRIQNIVNYRTGKMWKVRHTVILDGVYCEKDPSEYYYCDQTCFYYWREAWLKRVEDEKDERV